MCLDGSNPLSVFPKKHAAVAKNTQPFYYDNVHKSSSVCLVSTCVSYSMDEGNIAELGVLFLLC